MTSTSAAPPVPLRGEVGVLTCHDVRHHGAVGDGRAKDTVAIQSAIDHCAAAGGGQVVVPAGTYVCGTLYLKDNVDLHLSGGARIVASPDRVDYNDDRVFAENVVFDEQVPVTGAHLIIAHRARNVSITGPGCIDGNSSAFLDYGQDEHGADHRARPRVFGSRGWRPGQLVFFCRTSQVRIVDVEIVDAPYWTLFLLGCDGVQITRVRIFTPAGTPNGDGIDLDCCQDVTVSDCHVTTGDDAITVRANAAAVPDRPVSENIAVTNCLLSSSCNAIRVGVGSGEIRHVLFSNLVIVNTRLAINVVCRYSRDGDERPEIPPGASIHHVTFSDMMVDCVLPVTVTAGPGSTVPAALHDITFTRLRFRGQAGCHVAGSSAVRAHRISFEDVDFEFAGGSTDLTLVDQLPDLPSVNGYVGSSASGQSGPTLPAAIYAVHTDDLRLSRARVRWVEPSPVWRHQFAFRDCSEVVVEDTTFGTPNPELGPSVLVDRVDRLTVRRCDSELDAARLLGHVSGSSPTVIRSILSSFGSSDSGTETAEVR